jgi:hypothetical protein
MRSAAVRVSSRLLSKSRTGSCVQSLNGPAFTTHSHTISYTRCTCAHRPQLPTGVREHVRAAVAVDHRKGNEPSRREGRCLGAGTHPEDARGSVPMHTCARAPYRCARAGVKRTGQKKVGDGGRRRGEGSGRCGLPDLLLVFGAHRARTQCLLQQPAPLRCDDLRAQVGQRDLRSRRSTSAAVAVLAPAQRAAAPRRTKGRRRSAPCQSRPTQRRV